MATRSSSRSRGSKKTAKRQPPLRLLIRWGLRAASGAFLLAVLLIALGTVVNPPTTFYMFQESRRLVGVDQDWVPLEQIAPVMARSVVAAEDANFCEHWGFDLKAIKLAIAEGADRGASTLSQQTVKNVYLWHGRNYTRKAMEALLTPLLEAIWSKRRIIEVYLNVAEFDEGVFGIGAASEHYFGVAPAELSDVQAARLAAILPAPKARSASNPTSAVRQRARQVLDGAATIRADGRADCFES